MIRITTLGRLLVVRVHPQLLHSRGKVTTAGHRCFSATARDDGALNLNKVAVSHTKARLQTGMWESLEKCVELLKTDGGQTDGGRRYNLLTKEYEYEGLGTYYYFVNLFIIFVPDQCCCILLHSKQRRATTNCFNETRYSSCSNSSPLPLLLDVLSKSDVHFTDTAVPDSSSQLKEEGSGQTSACGDVDAIDDDEMEQEEMFVDAHASFDHKMVEWGGPRRGGRLPEPTRFGDWERKGRCTDF